MGIVKSMAREMAREIGSKSREFYEFVLPPVDMHLDDTELTVVIDIPGFKKEEIRLAVAGNILSISAKKPEAERPRGETICSQRPAVIDKKIRLPIRVRDGEGRVTPARYSDGVLTLSFPVRRKGTDIPIE